MMIPTGPVGTDAEGYPTLYPSRLRRYGAAPEHDRFRGCPAQYRAIYVTCACGHDRQDHDGPNGECRTAVPFEECAERCEKWRSSVPKIVQPNNPAEFGGAVHAALFHMEEHACGPEEALQYVWSEHLDVEAFAEATELLNKYLTRGGPMTRYSTLAVEIELTAMLYEDEDFGPVYFAGVIDWLGLDINESQIVHHVDYKSNRQPLNADEVRRDLQMRGYDWLVHQCWQRLGLPGRPHTIAHMDGLRWNDVEVRYTDLDRAQWAEWAAAIARKILRDTKAPEVLGPGCRWCPRRFDCAAYRTLPGVGESIAARSIGTSLDDLWAWRQEAADVRKTLDDGIADVDRIFADRVRDEGPITIDDTIWQEEPVDRDVLDMQALHRVLGDTLFYEIAGASKKAVEQLAKAHPDLASAMWACFDRMTVSRRVVRKKVDR